MRTPDEAPKHCLVQRAGVAPRFLGYEGRAIRGPTWLCWTRLFALGLATNLLIRKPTTTPYVTLSAFLLATLMCTLPTVKLSAQEHGTVAVGWTETLPFIYRERDGELGGLFVDFLDELSKDVGFEVQFVEQDGLNNWARSLAIGTTEMMPGVSKNPAFGSSVVYSDLMFASEAFLMVRIEDVGKIDPKNLGGLIVGTIPPTPGSDASLLPGAKIAAFDNASNALAALLSGRIDAISSATLFSYTAARTARLDNRVALIGEPLLAFEQFVALHDSRAELIGPINAALTQMKIDGRLQAISAKYFLKIPLRVPDILSVGVYHFPPYQVVQPNGEMSGFSVEVLRDLAQRAGVKIAFEEITLEQWQAGPGAGGYDMLPQAGINDDRRARMDFAYPIEQASLVIFMRRGEADGITGLGDLIGKRIGASAVNLARDIFEQRGDMELVTLGDQHDHLTSLFDGRTDAIVYPPQAMHEAVEQAGKFDLIAEIVPPVYISERAPALRPGLGVIRERLNAVTTGYLISSDYRELRQKWFGEPVFWTQNRIYTAFGLLGILFTGLIGLMLLLWRQRQMQYIAFQERELESQTRHSGELQTLVHKLELSNDNLNDFAYIASHDLKEPLRGIAINADFLSREEISGASKKRIDRMVMLTTRMEQLITDLLHFSRLGRDEQSREQVDLLKIIKYLETDLEETLHERRGKITIATDLPVANVESTRVRTVFYNLIVNGLTYNDSAQKVLEIGFMKSALVNGEHLRDVFYVKDNGIGIEEKNREKIYRIFTRLNREADYGRGTGAGLSFVKKVIEIYGCMLTFVSTPGAGTTFYFTLPLVEVSKAKIDEREKEMSL